MLSSVAAKSMGVSEDAAVKKLQAKMMLPVRKPAKGMALVVSHQNIKRVFGHLNGSLSFVAVSTFVKRTHALKGIGSWTTPSLSSTRRVLKQSPEECLDLLRADSFVKDAHGRMVMLDVLASVIEELEAKAMMVSWTGLNKATRVILCLFGHVANVTIRVCLRVPSLFPSLACLSGSFPAACLPMFLSKRCYTSDSDVSYSDIDSLSLGIFRVLSHFTGFLTHFACTNAGCRCVRFSAVSRGFRRYWLEPAL